jgi:hypothetical protein
MCGSERLQRGGLSNYTGVSHMLWLGLWAVQKRDQVRRGPAGEFNEVDVGDLEMTRGKFLRS